MEDDGFVTRIIYPKVPPRVEYNIMARGLSFMEALYHYTSMGSRKYSFNH